MYSKLKKFSCMVCCVLGAIICLGSAFVSSSYSITYASQSVHVMDEKEPLQLGDTKIFDEKNIAWVISSANSYLSERNMEIQPIQFISEEDKEKNGDSYYMSKVLNKKNGKEKFTIYFLKAKDTGNFYSMQIPYNSNRRSMEKQAIILSSALVASMLNVPDSSSNIPGIQSELKSLRKKGSSDNMTVMMVGNIGYFLGYLDFDLNKDAPATLDDEILKHLPYNYKECNQAIGFMAFDINKAKEFLDKYEGRGITN